MILEEETFKRFGYYPSDLKFESQKRILAKCEDCGIVREVFRHAYRDLCFKCACQTKEHKKKMSNINKGRKLTEEHKHKISDANKGETYIVKRISYFLGKEDSYRVNVIWDINNEGNVTGIGYFTFADIKRKNKQDNYKIFSKYLGCEEKHHISWFQRISKRGKLIGIGQFGRRSLKEMRNGPAGKRYRLKINAKRRKLGFIPLNSPFEGCEGHHLTLEHVLYIPKRIHRSVYHNIFTEQGITQINSMALFWLQNERREKGIECKVFAFDIDDTICDTVNSDYENSKIKLGMVKFINTLYDEGNIIRFLTARGMTTGMDLKIFTENQLEKWGIKYHDVLITKPFADVYIDNKSISHEYLRVLMGNQLLDESEKKDIEAFMFEEL